MAFYLLRYAEIGLKGKNRFFFENLLVDNIKKHNSCIKIKKIHGRFLAETDKNPCFMNIFGLASYSYAVKVDIDFKKIADVVLSLKKDLGRFRVSCQRIDKRIPLRSVDVERDVGEILFEKGFPVDLKNFDSEVCIELIDGFAFVFLEKVACFGGLPVGSQSRVAVLIKDEKDVLAGLLALKRGCSLLPFCFSYTNENSFFLLKKFGAKGVVILDSLDDLDSFLVEKDCLLLYSGQCLDDFSKIRVSCPVIRPLFFYDEAEIKKEISIFKDVLS
jgi:tRNA uracil 4-sulfurtransferase